MRALGFEHTFPFMTLDGWPMAAGLATVSAAASVLYVSVAGLLFEAMRRIAAPAPVTFVARNTLLIFLAHMPVYYALHPVLVSWGLGYWARVGVQLVVCLPGLALLSEAIRALVRPDRLRARVFETLTTQGPARQVGRVSLS